MIAVTHVYSRDNAGDGLLFDLTLARLRAAGANLDQLTIVAMDPGSFSADGRAVGTGTPSRSADLRTLGAGLQGIATAAASALPHIWPNEVARALREADGIVAVGGGYLRAGTCVNRAGTLINHAPQLLFAAHSRVPAFYMPQSVGPLRGATGRFVRRQLHRVSELHLRDDRSLAEVGASPHIHRTPDLAVLQLADEWGHLSPRSSDGSAVLVARRIEDAPEYGPRLHALSRLLDGARWAVQAEGEGSKSDRAFYTQDLDVHPAGRLHALLDEPGPVVSVRLHGALQAMLLGVPAIHLGYERKSWGAYEDLGLHEWLHPARSFDPSLVARQVRRLQQDPEPFWQAVAEAVPRLRQQSQKLTKSLEMYFAERRGR